MKHLDLIGTNLKGDFLCDLFETYDVQVTYEYDRNHENLPDKYHAKISELGLQFVFDSRQILRTLFIQSVETTTFDPFEDDEERMRRFSTKLDALLYARENRLSISEGSAEFMGERKDWVRFERDKYSIHYEYVESELRMITLQASDTTT